MSKVLKNEGKMKFKVKENLNCERRINQEMNEKTKMPEKFVKSPV